MCTVSLVAQPEIQNGFVLTSNRDEINGRENLAPSWEEYLGVQLYFPKDKLAGGTWLGASERQRLICLLNGGYKKHERKQPYRKSRGVVVKDFLAALKIDEVIKNYNLENIEPFTMVIADWQEELTFLEFVWDGVERHRKNLQLTSHIWSSSPLYSEEMKAQRRQWFEALKSENKPGAEALLEFHHSAGVGDKNIDLVMDRGFLKTQSISQIEKITLGLRFWYKDLANDKVSESILKF
ncbi:NRDE family protein [Zunongwangia sp. F363]|uniref:NRDE family protein n=1 Tax=Autumnicola tepida TaxID=3075595 RepID=A0ABU3C5R8_9FLAO|nr:NRDE family protein [Zunongwangia sp. F363]MDT0641672.1 NRDE family protein [Zunongwangia sp. F363]